MRPIGYFAGALLCLGLAGAALADDSTVQVQKILDRAFLQMAQVREGSVDIESSLTSTELENGDQVTYWSRDRICVREPDMFWNEELTSTGSSTLRWSDGKILRAFQAYGSRAEMAERKIVEHELIEGDYSKMLGGRKFSQLSMMRDAVRGITRAMDNTKPEGRRHLGTRQYGGETCDVIEMSGPGMEPDSWSKTRAMFPNAPEEGLFTYTLYLRASDGFPLRLESSEWGSRKIGEEIIYTARTDQRMDLRYGPAPPPSDFDIRRFNAVVKGMANTGKSPEIEKVLNKWEGKPVPQIALTTVNGKPVSFSDYKGRVLVIETWFTGCVYCKQAMPFYEKMRRKLKDQGVEFFALNVGQSDTDSPQNIRRYVKKSGSTFGFHWVLSAEPNEAISAKLGTQKGAAPDFFVIGRDGNFVMGYEGYGYGEGSEDPRLIHALKKAGIEL